MLNIECAELLSSRHQFEFIDEIFNFRNVQSLSVRGRIAPTGSNPTTEIYSRLALLVSGANDYEGIIVNNVDLGTGRITSFESEAGLDVLSKKYTFDIELYRTGNLHNLTGSYYDGVDMQTLSISGAQFIKSISENFSFNNNSDETYSFNRSLDLELDGGISNNPAGYAKGIADIFFLNSPELAILNANYPNFYLADGHKTRTEKYDTINYKYSFNEEFTSAGNNDWYSWVYENSVNFGERNATVSENGTIKGLKTSPYTYALSGFNDIKTGIYTRCNDAYHSWSIVLGDTTGECSLIDSPLSKGVGLNQFLGAVEYNYEYSTDSNRAGCQTHDYTTTINRDSEGIFNVNSNGTVCYVCNPAGEDVSAFIIDEDVEYVIDEDTENLLYDTVPSGIEVSGRLSRILSEITSTDFISSIQDRSYAVYANSISNTGIPCKTAGNLNLIGFSKEFSESDGCFTYGYDYSDDPTVDASGNYIKSESTKNINYPVHLTNKFNVVNFKEVAQPSNQSTLGTLSNNITIIGKRGQSLSDLLTRAFTFVEKPSYDLTHMASANYSWEPAKNILNLNVDYQYTQYREFSDIFVS